ncbi:hypothetical protein GCM10027048_20350 [Hymenobacter coalescens]
MQGPQDSAGARGLLLVLGLVAAMTVLTALKGCTTAALPATLRQEYRQHDQRAQRARKHRPVQRPIPHPYPTWRTK